MKVLQREPVGTSEAGSKTCESAEGSIGPGLGGNESQTNNSHGLRSGEKGAASVGLGDFAMSDREQSKHKAQGQLREAGSPASSSSSPCASFLPREFVQGKWVRWKDRRSRVIREHRGRSCRQQTYFRRIRIFGSK